MRITVELPEELLERTKVVAKQRGISLSELIGRALERELVEGPRRTRSMTEPPVKLGDRIVVPSLSTAEMKETLDEEGALESAFLRGVEANLSQWSSPEDNEAYRGL
jgi:hypothetical protein